MKSPHTRIYAITSRGIKEIVSARHHSFSRFLVSYEDESGDKQTELIHDDLIFQTERAAKQKHFLQTLEKG